MRRKTIQTEANTAKRMESYNKSPYFAKKYVNNRGNSFAELKRIYVYILGNTKGYTALENRIKAEQPDACKSRGSNTEWHLDTNKVWDTLMSYERINKIVTARKINNYEELSSREYTY